MNVNTLTVSEETAEQKLLEYKAIPAAKRSSQDEALLRAYRAAQKGHRIMDVVQAFRDTALNDQGQPKLAIARAHWETVHFHPRETFARYGWPKGAGGFSESNSWNCQAKQWNFVVPEATFADDVLTKKRLSSPVPHIPPALRPDAKLEAHHILFEVESWDEYPADPFLLKRISGSLFVVLAEWDLSELERGILASLIQ